MNKPEPEKQLKAAFPAISWKKAFSEYRAVEEVALAAARAKRQAPTRSDKAAEIAAAFGDEVDVNAVSNILDILGNDGIVMQDPPNDGH